MNPGVLERGRAVAESLMQSTVRIRRRSATKTRNPQTGREEYTWSLIYEGPARLRADGAQPQDQDAAGQQVTDRQMRLWLPIAEHPDIVAGTSSDVHVDDVGTLTANPWDPKSVGTEFRVRDGHVQTHSTARRLPVEVTSHA
ncbi:DUF6093 family protein [Microbacterium sp. NPDC007973]|uniref:DUF6093 family protein n=1 Tax=Microbacterium sp. NPDC007973 TaxID=3364182 RepID=UPI0036EED158